MRMILRFFVRLILLVVVLGALGWFFLPRTGMGPLPDLSEAALGDDPGVWLATRESRHEDIVPGTEARILWANGDGHRTEWALVYLHGFSASSEEIRPVPEDVARALGANLLYTRLTGHGRDGEALGAATATDWAQDLVDAIAAANALGDRVALIGTSTGATLAAIAAADPDLAKEIDAVAMISPNFGVRNPAARILTLPAARFWLPLVAGETLSFEPVNEDQARYWTESYPVEATIAMQATVEAAEAADLSSAEAPALVLYSEADEVVRPDATRAAMGEWGGEVSWVRLMPGEGVDPSAHVLAGDILSPALTERVTNRLVDFLAGVPDTETGDSD